MRREYLDKGGSVLVPQAPEEPDQRIDKMTGLPYDQQAGGAFVDEEDRLGFSTAGIVSLFRNIRRLSRGPKDIVADTRPVTRFDADQQFKDTLTDFRYKKPNNFIDPNSSKYSVSKITVDTPEHVEGFTKFLGQEENINLRVFNSLEESEQSAILETFRLSSPQNEFVGIKTTRKPNDKYWKDTKNTKDRITKEVDDDLSRIPQEDLKYVQEYADSVPRKSSKPPAIEDAFVSKQEFLEGSVEKNPQYNGSYHSEIKYDNDLSTAIPRELGLHVGTETHARTMLIRKTHPLYDTKIEEDAIRRSILKGQTRDEARVRGVNEGVDDDIVENNLIEMFDRVPIGVEVSLRKGFINVKNPLVIETDFTDWNPAAFLGGKDDSLQTLSKQAQDLQDAIKAQVKLPDEQVTRITDEAMEKINFFVRKKDMNSDEFMNDVYNFHINKTTKTMLEDLGFDSIKYKNLGEITKRSERQAGGGYSYILFNEGQFKTSFKQADGVNVQMASKEYDAAFKQFDNIDDVEEWQNAVKSYVKSNREINPDVRTPELEKSAQDFLAGKINREQHLQNIDTYKPVKEWNALPKEPSNKDLVFSLDDTTRYRGNFIQLDDDSLYNKSFVHKKGNDNLNIKKGEEFKINKGSLSVGDKFNGRLQIPSYTTFDAWIIAGTGGSDKGTTYAKAIHYAGKDGEPVKFIAGVKKGEEIASGQTAKTGYATISGWVKSLDVDEIRNAATKVLDDQWTLGRVGEAWTQGGFDPRRQTKFYVRDKNNRHVPILQGDEAIQIGPLVLVKNAVLDKGYQGLATGGKVLGGLKRTRRAEGGLIGRILAALKKVAGRGPQYTRNTHANATELNNRMVDEGVLPESNRVEWVLWKQDPDWKEGDDPKYKHLRGEDKRKIIDRKLTVDELRKGGDFGGDDYGLPPTVDEEPYNAINHALLSFDQPAGLHRDFLQGREHWGAEKAWAAGRDPRTEHLDRWNNSYGIESNKQGLSLEQFEDKIINDFKGGYPEGGPQVGQNLITNYNDLPESYYPERHKTPVALTYAKGLLEP